MDWFTTLLILLLLGIVVGQTFYIVRRLQQPQSRPTIERNGLEALRLELDARFQAEIERFRREAEHAFLDISKDLEQVRLSLHTSANEQISHVARLQEQSAEFDGKSIASLESALTELRNHHRDELAELSHVLRHRDEYPIQPTQTDAGWTRRQQAIADLGARLATLDAAVTATLAPELLPGETVDAPIHLSPQALLWPSWKETGDAAFAFAEVFAINRLALDDVTESELAQSITLFRRSLTRGLYGNLNQINSDPAARDLAEVAAADLVLELHNARMTLSAAYRAGAATPPFTRQTG